MGNGYYPPGTEFDSTAPWNESPPEMRDFDVCISQTLSRNTTVSTKDYSISLDCDDEGVYYENVDTSNIDWKNLYLSERMTPLELIVEFKSFLEKTLPDPTVFPKEHKKAKYLISECEGWVEDDLEIMEN